MDDLGLLLIIGGFIAPAIVILWGDLRYQANRDRETYRRTHLGDD